MLLRALIAVLRMAIFLSQEPLQKIAVIEDPM
jgi:hypothetical protein